MNRFFRKSVLLVALFALAVGSACARTPSSEGVNSSVVHQRIVDSKKIRVGYVPVALALDVDPKTAQVSGIFVDILREMGKNMGLEVEFVEEVGWGTMIAGLQTDRYDMIGSPVWPNSTRAKQATFSEPVYFSAIGVWVRETETRFSPASAWAVLNDPKVRIGAIDGSTGETIALTQFPNATLVTYPELTAEGQIFMDVEAGKVDVFFEEPAKGVRFVENNPGKVKNIGAAQPVKVFANIFMMPAGDYRLKEMIDTALQEVHNSGFVERTLAKYEPAPDTYYRVSPPYRTTR